MSRNPKLNSEGYLDLTAYNALTAIACEERQAQRQYRPIVYICSPFTGDIERNVDNARRYCAFAVRQGTIPIAPHLLFPQFLDDSDPEDRKLGLLFGKILLDRCEAVWRFGGTVSTGMVAELERAKRRGIPIKHYDTDCKEVTP